MLLGVVPQGGQNAIVRDVCVAVGCRLAGRCRGAVGGRAAPTTRRLELAQPTRHVGRPSACVVERRRGVEAVLLTVGEGPRGGRIPCWWDDEGRHHGRRMSDRRTASTAEPMSLDGLTMAVPAAPCGPWEPGAPCAPFAPLAPLAPRAPCGPATPCRPATPCGPTAPWAPSAPCGPV